MESSNGLHKYINLKPLISVIMPAYNAGGTIAQSIDSVLNQSYENWELIIINDNSTDNTGFIIDEYYKKDKRILVVGLEKNGGLPNARNEGIIRANGKYIAFLDSDDTWHAQKLMKQVSFHLANPQIRISHTKFEIFNEFGILKTPFKKIVEYNYKKEGFLLPSIYSKNTIGVLTVMVERELLLAVGGFDASLWTMEDQDLWIKVAKLGECFGYINENLAKYRLSPNGITNKVGKYKRAYKKLIDKYQSETKTNNSYSLVLANYYRYFGIVYFKRKAYKISLLYLIKSIKFEKYILDIVLTSAFIFMVFVKNLIANGINLKRPY